MGELKEVQELLREHFRVLKSVSRPFFPACAPSRGLCDSSECCPLEMALRKKPVPAHQRDTAAGVVPGQPIMDEIDFCQNPKENLDC